MSKEIALTPVKQLCKTIQGMEQTFQQALPSQVPSKKFVRTVLMAIQDEEMARKINENKIDKNSLFISCQKAAADGLVLDNREAALVTFWNKDKGKFECQYMPMVSGIIKKMRNTGDISTVSAHVVYEKDTFEHILGLKEDIKHTRPKLGEPRGEMIGAYAVVHLKDGSYQICVMDKNQIEAVKKCAKTKQIWEGPFADQQWEKTPIRRIAKRLPSSSDLERLFENDNENYDLGPETAEVDVTPQAETSEKTKETKAAQVVKKSTKKEPITAAEVVDAEIVEEESQPPHPAEEDGDII